MKVYAVGGAVRDRLLGRPAGDRDWVVVGSTAEAMEAMGFRRVGRDFPVFLHPETHEEYALARRERKVAPGYTGFVFDAHPDVTLEEDLERRDLTINAMAEAADGRIIDPWGGQADLALRCLRHVSPAFAEDPVRILRTARFAARLDWSVAPATLALMRQMVADGEVDALVPERVWAEWQRALEEAHPQRFLAVLEDCGALQRLWPELATLLAPANPDGLQARAFLAAAVDRGADACVRNAALLHPMAGADGNRPAGRTDPQPLANLLTRTRAPREFQDLALLAAQHAPTLADYATLDAAGLWQAMQACDGMRRPERFRQLAEVVAARVQAGASRPLADAVTERLLAALTVARQVDSAAMARAGLSGQALGQALATARCTAIARYLAGERAEAE